MAGKSAKPTFFATPADWRAWLARNAARETELLVGFWKKSSGKPSITWPESVDEALCFGWIDGVRRSLGDEAYTIRFTPRKPTSIWSRINLRKVEELRKAGKMTPAGEAAFAHRKENRIGVYSFEQRPSALPPADEKRMRANKAAWAWWKDSAPSYQRAAIWWVISAKKPETHDRRLATLIELSAKGKRLPHLEPRRPTASSRSS